MRILVTAIGSMSAECVIKQLKLDGHFVVGCDIYPGEWHYETKLCDCFLRAPLATAEYEYVEFLLTTCQNFDIQYITPLTDLEIDVINRHRTVFEKKGVVLCMQSSEVLNIVRNKFNLHQFFVNDNNVPSIRTSLLEKLPSDFKFPCIAKPFNGRSSEGLIRNATYEQVMAITNKDAYIVQEQIDGDVFTVDYCRSSKSNTDCAIPRRELLRTKNGAGLTVQMVSDLNLINLVSHIGNRLNVNGCVNMEFIYNSGDYYLIDINPRFSAGVSFSVLSGYNMICNHMYCYIDKIIDLPIKTKECIIAKKYQEIFI